MKSSSCIIDHEFGHLIPDIAVGKSSLKGTFTRDHFLNTSVQLSINDHFSPYSHIILTSQRKHFDLFLFCLGIKPGYTTAHHTAGGGGALQSLEI